MTADWLCVGEHQLSFGGYRDSWMSPVAEGDSLLVEPGQLILRLHRTDPPTWTVTHADPQVAFTDELLTAAEGGFPHPYPSALRLEPHFHGSEECGISCPATHQRHGEQPCFWGWLVHIDATNRHVVYRITGHDWLHELWLASWPD